MESIWVDLCDTVGSTLSPDWHGNVLADRKAAALAGKDEIIDWETAKQKIFEDLQCKSRYWKLPGLPPPPHTVAYVHPAQPVHIWWCYPVVVSDYGS